MTQQNTYGQDPLQAPQYPAHPGYGQPVPGYEQHPQQQKTNTMAILGLIFAFVASPLGIVFSAIGLSQIKKRREGGRGLALAGLILSILFTVIAALMVVLVFVAASEIVETSAEAAPAAEELVEELEEPVDTGAPVPGDDATGVLTACEAILPALLDMESAMMTAATPEEFAQVIAGTRSALEVAAAGTTDAGFVADVQQLSDDLQLTADAVSAGEDPAYLEQALTESGMLVGEACAANGYVE